MAQGLSPNPGPNPGPNPSRLEQPPSPPASAAAILQQLQSVQIVYLGETHSSEADHRAQLKILEQLHGANPQLAIAFEMFQRPFQPVLDRYGAGEISEADLIAQTEYETRWGFPWAFYGPILRFGQAQKLPLLALNTPTEITKKVARQGLASLTPEDQALIPPLAAIDLSENAINRRYRKFVQGAFAHHHGSHSSTMDFENFFAAQVLWDETMAEAIAQFAQAHPDYQIVVLAGQGHVIYNYGIPSRVARRLGPTVRQATVLLNPSEATLAEENANSADDKIADFLWMD